MISVCSSELKKNTGLVGRKFVISGDDIDLEIFFGTPTGFQDLLNWREEIILPYLGILALLHGQDIDLDGAEVDPEFLRNVRCALSELARLHGGLRTPEISGSIPYTASVERVGTTGVFFSGGIDSFFSVLRLRDQMVDTSRTIGQLNYAIHIYHTDELSQPGAFETLRALSDSARACGMELIPIQSNFMTADHLMYDHWGHIGHGAGLATVLHLLSGGLQVGIIGSSHTWGGLMPWGSSPVVDPLWSSQNMKITHDDARYGRFEKTALVARSQEALTNLNVCDNRIDGTGYVNCSRCPKCLRTMVSLDLLDVRTKEQAPCFDWSEYSPSAFSKVFLRTESDATFAKEIRIAAAEHGRQDIVTACDDALKRGKTFRFVSRTEDHVKNTRLGRKYRSSLKRHRTRIYRAMGWATKPG